jgi:hypothetical protein
MTNTIENSDQLPKRLSSEGANQLSPGDLPPDIAELAAHPRVKFCGDIDMVINAKGEWFYNGTIIARPAMVRLFASIMQRDADGGYWLTTPVELTRIRVEDVPFMAVELIDADEATIMFRTNVDTIVTLDKAHPLRVETHSKNDGIKPYITVRDNLDALLERSVFYQLMELSVEREMDGKIVVGVWSSGCFFPIGITQ